MALFRCGAGKLHETSYWTNPNPSTNFTQQTVTLDSDITTNDFVEIKYQVSTSDTTVLSVIVPMDDWKKSKNMTGLGIHSTYYVARGCVYASDTTATFITAQVIGGSVDDSYCIPIEICGLKY